MHKVRIPTSQRFILDSVTWDRYTRLLREFSDRHFRMTFDRGVLEIMTLSHQHESFSQLLGLLVLAITLELNLPLHLGGSTTLRRKRKQKGLEPDNCYWIAHEADMRGKSSFNLRTDPPPDLAIEVDITHSSLNRMGIYASLRVPEVWRYDAQELTFFTLSAKKDYAPAAVSTLFSLPITPGDLMPFLQLRAQMDDNSIFRQFRDWLRARVENET